jgi:DNA-binding NtrC family response regulator
MPAATIRYHSFNRDGEDRDPEHHRVTKRDRAMAALLLGIGRHTLYRKLKEYGLAV